jgi:ERCC4-type nuclease
MREKEDAHPSSSILNLDNITSKGIIIIDTREKENVIIPYFERLNIPFIRHKLNWGDYYVGGGIYIERKEYKDFYASILDKRYTEQIPSFLRYEEILYPVIAITGIKKELIQLNPFIDFDKIEGAMASLFVRYGMYIWHFETDYDFVKFLGKVNKKLNENKQFSSRRIPSKNPLTEKILFLSQIVPPYTAIQLLVKFGSIKNIAEASIEQLKEIDGIGDIKARRIYNLFHDDINSFFNV